MLRIRRVLALKEVPHFTTCQKAFDRLSAHIWRIMHHVSVSLFPQEDNPALGIDASGYERSFASWYYTQRGQL
jgi:hypothetical protein